MNAPLINLNMYFLFFWYQHVIVGVDGCGGSLIFSSVVVWQITLVSFLSYVLASVERIKLNRFWKILSISVIMRWYYIWYDTKSNFWYFLLFFSRQMWGSCLIYISCYIWMFWNDKNPRYKIYMSTFLPYCRRKSS